MKQFPYAQQIIWENDVEQIEWAEKIGDVWYSDDYVAKVHPLGYAVVGVWRKMDDGLSLVADSAEYSAEELECWAKL